MAHSASPGTPVRICLWNSGLTSKSASGASKRVCEPAEFVIDIYPRERGVIRKCGVCIVSSFTLLDAAFPITAQKIEYDKVAAPILCRAAEPSDGQKQGARTSSARVVREGGVRS